MRLRSATGAPKSYDAATRTFEFVLASEKPCRTWRVDENWRVHEVDEVLPMSALVDLEEFVGTDLLQDHRYWLPPIGVVESARIEGDKLVCKGWLSECPDVDVIAQDIEDGIRRSFSIGFEILDDGTPKARKGDVHLITVKKWRAKEASLVSVPADDTAKIRSAKGAIPNSKTGARAMTHEELTELVTGYRAAFEGLMTALEGLANGETDGDEDDAEAEAEAAAEAARAAVLAKRSGTKPAARNDASAPSPAAQAAKLRSLREACKKNGRSADFKALEDSGADISKMQDLLIQSTRTSELEIDTTSKPGAGKRSGKLVTFSESAKVKYQTVGELGARGRHDR